MRRMICTLLACAIAAGMFIGCQKTPESPIVTGKNNEILIEKAKNTDGSRFSVLETENVNSAQPDATVDMAQYGIPETLNFTQTEVDGKLSIEVNAEVIAPERPLPIVRVEAAQFSQETVSALYKVFIGDTPMIETIDVMTKSQIESSLIYYRKVLADENAEPVDKDFAERYIQELTAEYETAPESIQATPANDELKYLTETFDGRATVHYYGIKASSKDEMHYFQVCNDRDNEQAIELIDYDSDGNPTGGTIIPLSRSASIAYVNNEPRPNYKIGDDSLRLNRDDALPVYAQSSLQLKPAEAAATVERFIQEAGLSDLMAIQEICLISDKDPRNGVSKPTAYAYNIECTRLIQDSPCAKMNGVSIQADAAMAPIWGYESCSFQVDDAGVFYFYWSAPMQVTETVVESATLMHFTEIESIIKKMLPIIYEPEAHDEYYKGIELTADSMTLSLQRIAEQNNFERAMLVPAWNVYGFYTRKGFDEDLSYTERGALLTINAIDGSIIDPSKGY